MKSIAESQAKMRYSFPYGKESRIMVANLRISLFIFCDPWASGYWRLAAVAGG
jgi:hypothetical protein